MSDKRGDRYCGQATRRKSKLDDTATRFHALCLEVENNGDKLLKIAHDKNDSALLEIANSLLYSAVFNQGWIES